MNEPNLNGNSSSSDEIPDEVPVSKNEMRNSIFNIHH